MEPDVKERSYWLDTLGQSELLSSHSEIPGRADVVVIGGGYSGLSAARCLARSGAAVVVVERQHLGFGASSRNGGQVLTGLRLDPATLVRRYGESTARTLYEAALASIVHLEELIAAESIDCDYERTGHLHAAWKPSHFNGLRKEQSLLARVCHHRVELLSRDEQRAEIGSDAYHGVLVDERSGSLNPARYVEGLARSARHSGATLATGVSVQRLVRGDRWSVHTDRGTIDAADVLIATNGYTGSATPDLQRRIVPVGSYAIATAPLTAEQCSRLLPRRRMVFDSKHFLYYFRLTADRRLLFGGRASFTPPDANTTRTAARTLQRGIATVFPELADVAIDYAWGGFVAFTRDERPHAGRLDDGAYFAAGYAGHGIAMATMLGELTARRIAGEHVSFPFVDDQCPAIPLYRGTPWFLPFVGAYYRVLDWIS